MTKLIGQSLVNVPKLLGIAGSGEGPTEFDDNHLQQVLDVGPTASRAQSPINQAGWFTFLLLNEHAGAGVITNALFPSAQVGANPAAMQNGYPGRQPGGFDLWLGQVSMLRTGGAGDLNLGQVYIVQGYRLIGLGVTDAGVAHVGDTHTGIARWDDLEATAGMPYFGITEGGEYSVKPMMRVPPGSLIYFSTDAAAAADFECCMVMGMFPSGMGQDIVK